MPERTLRGFVIAVLITSAHIDDTLLYNDVQGVQNGRDAFQTKSNITNVSKRQEKG